MVRLAKPTRVVLVGDLFTKGPSPEGVWAQIRSGDYAAVMGNHDLRLVRSGSKDRAVRSCIERLDAAVGKWRKWTEKLPLFESAGPFTVVHAGLHPSGSLKQTSEKMAVSMRRYPGENSPFWWQNYTGKRRVIFGHDARRGLIRVERKRKPWLIGLDTGCVYGGQLSGYLVEEDRLLQVPARRVYQEPG